MMNQLSNKMKRILLLIITLLISINSFALYILIPMDNTQKNHLKAYGIAYWILKQDGEVSWLLNYSGGAFLVK
ncbi:MAG: hypothetical protein WCX10_08840, partial [Bacteroidales bacterium]